MDDMEMECDKLMSQKEILEDQIGNNDTRTNMINKEKREIELKFLKHQELLEQTKKKIDRFHKNVLK